MHFGTRDSWDEIGRIGRKWNRVHFKFELEKFETKSSGVRDSAGSGEIGTERTFEIGTFGTRKCEVRGSGGSAEIGTSRTVTSGHLGQKLPTGPKMGQIR
ncbi:hypothetical protein KI387_043315, partial [Taxus chinensis]